MKRHAPATARNSGPIAEVLASELPKSGLILEVASGTGEHSLFFARRFPDIEWQPSDVDASALSSIDAYSTEGGVSNIRPAVVIDAVSEGWTVGRADAILCINMAHISPWEATKGLFREAAVLLEKDAPLILYGPYLEQAVETAPSNLDFDTSLKSRDPRWGLRSIEEMDALATANGFARTARYEMPANNLTLVYRKT